MARSKGTRGSVSSNKKSASSKKSTHVEQSDVPTPTESFYIAFGLDQKKGEVRSYFLSEGLESVEAWVANGGKRVVDTASSPNEKAQEIQDSGLSEKKERKEYPFQVATTKFINSMNRLNLIIPRTMTFLPRLELLQLNRSLYQPLKRASKQISKSEAFEIYECGFDQLKLVNTVGRQVNQLKDGRTSLPGMFLMGLISSYDAFLADLMRLIFLTKPEMLSASEKNISFKDLVELGSIEAARNQIIEKEVETFLRQSHHSQFDILESRLAIPLRKDLLSWPQFVEICERRNLFTHTNGVVSRQYLQVCADHKVKLDEIAVGQQLRISAPYLRDAVEIVTELGWKLTQVVWRKLKPDEAAQAAHALIQGSFELLKRGQFGLARKMLEFGLTLRRQSDEESGKIMVVNLAIATKLRGDVEGAKAILDKEDWSASRAKFRICVAAVLDDVDKVVAMLPNITNDEIDKNEYRDWPAFQSMTGEQKFVQAFEKKFGEPFMLDRESRDEAGGSSSN
jgi:hypothetical protein